MPRRFRTASDPVSTGAARGELLRITDVAAGPNDFAATDGGFVLVAKFAGGVDQANGLMASVTEHVVVMRDKNIAGLAAKTVTMPTAIANSDTRNAPSRNGRLNFIPR